jgi:hypothetical protein
LILRVGRLAAAIGNRLEVLELNPVIVNARHPGGIIADARLLLFPRPRTMSCVTPHSLQHGGRCCDADHRASS